MYFANRHYVNIINLSTTPKISRDEALNTFLRAKQIGYEQVVNTIIDLLIKEIKTNSMTNSIETAQLVFRVYLESDHPNNNEVGYINAHTGELVLTEPRLLDLEGTFATRYSGSRQADTDPITGGHRLFDNTRGATIHTLNLQNNSTVLGNAVEITDNDNNWTSLEHSGNNNDMGLDVHWALQETYDYLNNTYNINSFDDDNEPINAYIRHGNNNILRDNAFWDGTQNVLLFGQGVSLFRPLASLDVVGHEYGHGITDFQIGWGGTGDQGAFNEGLSDIWGAILEQRLRPNNTWLIGEQISIITPHLRNIENTNDANAFTQISDTFLSAQYKATNDSYVRSGVFSHWFYILVEGESGTNDLNNTYAIDGIGLDFSEQIIVEAVFNNYLDGTTTYPEIRTAMINAAIDLFGSNSCQVIAVTNAWNAVGVGEVFPITLSIQGENRFCATENYTVQNLPIGATVTWSISPISGLATLTTSGNTATLTRIGNNNGDIQLIATVNTACGVLNVTPKTVYVGVPQITAINLNTVLASGYWCANSRGNYFDIELQGGLNPNGLTFQIQLLDPATYQVFANYTVSGGSGTFALTRPPYTTYLLQARVNDPSCGTSETWFGYEMEFIDCSNNYRVSSYNVYPNPANSDLTIEYAPVEESIAEKTTIKSKQKDIKLFNNKGEIMASSIMKENKVKLTLDTKNIPGGTYFLHITEGKEIIKKQIIIKH